MKHHTILSGMQPTGELHLGNYLGALKNFVELQEQYDCYFFIATYHSLTIAYDPGEKRQQIRNLAKAYLAAGVDPKRSIVFDQADVPAHMELNWIFNTLTPIAEAERMTQFKDKSAKNSKNINLGLLTYPILQAADILLYRATAVPVGIDQVQHVELTRKIARWFNNRYKVEFFAEPETILTKTPKVQSLLHPDKKMSKSDGANAYVGILDTPDTIRKKVKKAVTGTGTETTTPEGAANLLALMEEFGAADRASAYRKDIKAQSVRYGDLKNELAEIIITALTPLQERYNQISDADIDAVLVHGAQQASVVANETLAEVKKIIGLTS